MIAEPDCPIGVARNFPANYISYMQTVRHRAMCGGKTRRSPLILPPWNQGLFISLLRIVKISARNPSRDRHAGVASIRIFSSWPPTLQEF